MYFTIQDWKKFTMFTISPATFCCWEADDSFEMAVQMASDNTQHSFWWAPLLQISKDWYFQQLILSLGVEHWGWGHNAFPRKDMLLNLYTLHFLSLILYTLFTSQPPFKHSLQRLNWAPYLEKRQFFSNKTMNIYGSISPGWGKWSKFGIF